MTEKIGLIRNPLTIIAIFAGIAEVSGTVVLPFVDQDNQQLFIYFLILFPSLLVLLFFLTLNFNNKVLYAPSDYKDEMNYVSINKYDFSSQKTVEVKVAQESPVAEQLALLVEKSSSLQTHLMRLEAVLVKKDEVIDGDILKEEAIEYEVLVSNFWNAGEFIRYMNKYSFNVQIYHSPTGMEQSTFSGQKAIWLGQDVPLEIAKRSIKRAKEFYPHLEYISVSELGEPLFKTVFIGGSTDSAVNLFNKTPLSDGDFRELGNIMDIKKLHQFIDSFSK